MAEPLEPIDNQVHLFTLRIWAVNKSETEQQWRCRLQNVQSGDVFFCDNLPSLLDRVKEALNEPPIAFDAD